jgi:hypothetical protein
MIEEEKNMTFLNGFNPESEKNRGKHYYSAVVP